MGIVWSIFPQYIPHSLYMIEILPDLPRQIKKKEQDITPKILKWFREKYKQSCAIEIKITNTDTFSHNKLEEHQLKALLEAQNGSLVHKIVDTRRRNPFDAFMLYNSSSWIVIYFTKHKKCIALSPKTLQKTHKITSTTKSELNIVL